MIELQNLRTFCAVADKKSFTKAGELVYRTQSTISSQISALEKFYDTTLFDRSQREVMLTESGKILYTYAKRILKLVDESKDKVNELNDDVKGHLIIGASTIPGTYILPRVLNNFKQQYPDVNVSVRISNSKDIITKILEHRLEIGVVGEKIKDKKLEYIELAKDKIVLAVNFRHPWVIKKNITLKELKTGKFIWREEGSGTRDTIEKTLKNKGIKGLNIVMELGSTEAVKQGVETGLGISFLSEWAIKGKGILQYVSTLRKVNVKLDSGNLNISRCFYMVFLKAGTKSRAVQSFIKYPFN